MPRERDLYKVLDEIEDVERLTEAILAARAKIPILHREAQLLMDRHDPSNETVFVKGDREYYLDENGLNWRFKRNRVHAFGVVPDPDADPASLSLSTEPAPAEAVTEGEW